MVKRKVGFIVVVVAVMIILLSCSTTSQVSTIIMYDNSALMAKNYDILSQNIIRLEIVQIENTRRTAETRSIHDRILEKVRVTYPNADDVLITSLEAVGRVTTKRSVSTEHFTYLVNVFPIKFR